MTFKVEIFSFLSFSDVYKRQQQVSEVELKHLVEALVKEGMKPNQAIKKVAKENDFNRQELYQLYHELQ